MRTLSGAMTTHIAGAVHRRVMMMRLDLVDGTSLGFTGHDREISFDLGDGAIAYLPRTGINPTAMEWSADFNADDVELDGPIGVDVTRAALLGGRFNDAVARLFLVDWGNLAAGAIPLLKGRVVLAEAVGMSFKMTVNGDLARYNQRRGRTITGTCDAEFGDTRCGYTPATLACTVTSVVSRRQFGISYTGSFADDYWNLGKADWQTGNLTGTKPVEIFKFDQSSAGVAGVKTCLVFVPSTIATVDAIAALASGERPFSWAFAISSASSGRTALKVSFGVALAVSKRISVTTAVIGSP